MKLIDAYNLLVEDGITDNHRFFAEVYKLYGFTDDKLLLEYLDFIAHEPVHWLKGFPAKLVTKLAFSKPKTAMVKLLKKQQVIQALGADYVTRIYETIWNTFKKEADAIVEERQKGRVVVQKEGEDTSSDAMSVGSVESIETYPTPPIYPKAKTQKIQHIESSNEFVNSLGKSVIQTTDTVEFLKEVILKMAEALPAGYADAFRLLVSRV
jgi:hypothetical protein